MRARFALIPYALILGACASGTSAPPPAPPAPAPAPAPAVAAPRPESAPDAWQLLDLSEDGVPGTSANRAYRELLRGRSPARTVVVAVIDGGVDTAHVDLRDVLWTNPGETPGNGRDDDGNGYVDDVYGWNFLGGPDGRSIDHETLEVTRLYVRCQDGERPPTGVTCAEVTEDFESQRAEAEGVLGQIDQIDEALSVVLPMLRGALGGEEPTAEAVRGIETSDPRLGQARAMFLQLDAAGLTPEAIEEAREAYEGRLEYSLDPDYRVRDIVGDDPQDGTQRDYGNRDVMGPDASHGTHVAGIIGAARGNGIGIDGIAAGVRLMAVRAVPNGDERDKDIANAIRYAVDNGADIINMSFGKPYSPEKPLVDAAIRYADERGVLMIHAAGNDGEDVDVGRNYPTPEYDGGGRARNWIQVGAANWVVDSLAAPFSNYGQARVDLFAPGVAILSTVPGSEFDRNDGTSMAAPAVTGVAALLMAYFPDLTAADVKRILLESATPYRDQMVPEPGSGRLVRFGTLSVTGAVLNAYSAVRMASDMM